MRHGHNFFFFGSKRQEWKLHPGQKQNYIANRTSLLFKPQTELLTLSWPNTLSGFQAEIMAVRT